MKTIIINVLLLFGVFSNCQGALSAFQTEITKSTSEKNSIKIDITFEETHLDDLLKLKFCIPRKSNLYPEVQIVGLVIKKTDAYLENGSNVLLSMKTDCWLTKKWFKEYWNGEFYIAKSFLDDDSYSFSLLLYDECANTTLVNLKSFFQGLSPKKEE